MYFRLVYFLDEVYYFWGVLFDYFQTIFWMLVFWALSLERLTLVHIFP